MFVLSCKWHLKIGFWTLGRFVNPDNTKLCVCTALNITRGCYILWLVLTPYFGYRTCPYCLLANLFSCLFGPTVIWLPFLGLKQFSKVLVPKKVQVFRGNYPPANIYKNGFQMSSCPQNWVSMQVQLREPRSLVHALFFCPSASVQSAGGSGSSLGSTTSCLGLITSQYARPPQYEE